MDNQELINFLRECLEIELEDDGQFLTAKILVGGEIIAEATEQICRV